MGLTLWRWTNTVEDEQGSIRGDIETVDGKLMVASSTNPSEEIVVYDPKDAALIINAPELANLLVDHIAAL